MLVWLLTLGRLFWKDELVNALMSFAEAIMPSKYKQVANRHGASFETMNARARITHAGCVQAPQVYNVLATAAVVVQHTTGELARRANDGS